MFTAALGPKAAVEIHFRNDSFAAIEHCVSARRYVDSLALVDNKPDWLEAI